MTVREELDELRKNVQALLERLDGLAERLSKEAQNTAMPSTDEEIADLGSWPLRVRNCLSQYQVHTWGQLAALSPRDVLRAKNVGVVCLEYIRSRLAARRLHLANDTAAITPHDALAYETVSDVTYQGNNATWRRRAPAFITILRALPQNAVIKQHTITRSLGMTAPHLMKLRHSGEIPHPDIHGHHGSVHWSAHKLADALEGILSQGGDL